MFRKALSGTLLATALAATPALAAPPTVDSTIEKIDAAVPARFVMGVKFGGGGTLWDGPDNTDIGVDEEGPFDTAIFDETRAGYTSCPRASSCKASFTTTSASRSASTSCSTRCSTRSTGPTPSTRGNGPITRSFEAKSDQATSRGRPCTCPCSSRRWSTPARRGCRSA